MNNDFKDNLKKINLKDFAERHYQVNWSGNKALCCFPGHKEKTPSLCYKPNDNYIFCQGCKRGGDIFTFIGLMENLDTKDDFIDIMKKICELESITLPESKSLVIDNEKIKLLQDKTTHALSYKKNLWASKESEAFNYLLNRGLTDKTINTFHLGKTDEKYDASYSSYITSKIGNNNEKMIMNLKNRISIPILNSKGDKVIAISFRSIESDSKYKYLHDKTDAVFHKKEVFYGFSHAYNYIKERDVLYIVEGYFDMMSMYQAGMENTVACMTNQMTKEQIESISKISKNIIVITDQDLAGQNGFKRSLARMLLSGMNVRVVDNLNYKGKDVNDLCNNLEWDANSIQNVINSNSKDGLMYYITSSLNKYDEGVLMLREMTMKVALPIIDCVQDPVKRINYLNLFNDRIGMKERL